MLFGTNIKQRNSTIVFRVTLWYSVFLFVFILALLALIFLLSSNLSTAADKKELVESATKIAQGTEEYEAVDDGIYYSIYDQSGTIIQKSLPNGFNEKLAFSQGTVKESRVGQRTYLYYDIESEQSDQWLRAVTLSYHSNHDLTDFLLAVTIVSPVLLIIIIGGGYILLKQAFVPIEKLSQTALEIRKSGDVSKRLHLQGKNDEIYRLGKAFNLMLDSIQMALEREKQFNNDVSHELRTPIAVILAESEYGLSYADDMEEAKESFQIINRQAKGMKEMSSQILELSKLEKQTAIEKKKLSLTKLVEEKVKDFKKLIQEKGCYLEMKHLDDCFIKGDKLLINRLLDNLLTNALKFTEDYISISIKKSQTHCQLSIEDNGPGISPTEIQKIWYRFYQIDPARNKKEQEGSGLGLALVHQIVQLHGEDMEIKAKPRLPKGTCFTLTFRLAEENLKNTDSL